MIFLLIGQKGSGKTFIGKLFEQYFNIKFIRVEDWAKALKKDRAVMDENYLEEVFKYIENGIRESLPKQGSLVFESTGLTPYFDQMLNNLRSEFQVVTIGVQADSSTCLKRVKSRNKSIHIDVSDEQVKKINKAALEKGIQTDFVIKNENKDMNALKEEISEILSIVVRDNLDS